MARETPTRRSFGGIFLQVSAWVLLVLGLTPVVLMVVMKKTAWQDDAMIFHSIVNYLLFILLSGLIWLGFRGLGQLKKTSAKRWSLMMVPPATLCAASGMAMEYLFGGFLLFLPMIIWAACRKNGRAVQMGLFFFAVSCGVAYVHHDVFLSRISTPWKEERAHRMSALVAQGVDQQEDAGCSKSGVYYEICLNFPDAEMDGFAQRKETRELVDELRRRQMMGGGSVSHTMRDKNDDFPIWAFGFDGKEWSVLMSKDTFYRDVIVPTMGYLWWWSVLAWGSFGVSAIAWHNSRPVALRRAEVGTPVRFAVAISLVSAAGVSLFGLAMSKVVLNIKVAPGDWTAEIQGQFLIGMQQISAVIILAWFSLGLLLWLFHLAICHRKGR